MPKTWVGRRYFHYTGSVETGTEIVYGKGWKAKVSVQDYIAVWCKNSIHSQKPKLKAACNNRG